MGSPPGLPLGGAGSSQVPAGADLVEWYFEQGWTDGLPVVPPTPMGVAVSVERPSTAAETEPAPTSAMPARRR